MKKILLMIGILISGCQGAFAGQCVQVPYGTNSQVTAVNLNAGLQEPCTIMNGGLDNTNANTASGYRFYQTVSNLPAAGNTGQVYYLTTDNSLNFDTGSTFIKTIGIAGSPAQGNVVYYGASGLGYLATSTTGTPLITQGASANPAYGEITAANTVSGAAITSINSLPSGAGIVPKANIGNLLGTWGNCSGSSCTITTAYLAATDLFVSGIGQSTNNPSSYACYTDSSNPPTTSRNGSGTNANAVTEGCSMVVRKGDYYEITGSSASLGNMYTIAISS